MIVELPDGRTLDIDTDDPKVAASAAKKFIGGAKPQAEAKPDDIYHSTAKKELADEEAKGIPTASPYQRRMLQGMTFNSADELLAGMATPIEMFKRGTWNPAEGFRYAKAREDLSLERDREKTGALGSAAEILGGAGSGLGLARAGITAARALPAGAGLFSRAGASAIDGGLLGGISGAMDGNSASERGGNALKGGLLGGAVGGATPLAISAGQTALSPLTSYVRARVNPEGFAQSQVARALHESGMTPSQLTGQVSQAAREGQDMFTLADAMGNPGQRMLSTVTRAPGAGRTEAVDFLEGRQAGQGRRISNTLAEGFDSPRTAAQTDAAMTASRDSAADVAYGAARNNAAPVDISNVIRRIDHTLQPGVNQIVSPQNGIANDSIESALAGIRSRLTDGRSVQTDFTALQRSRGDIADMAETARRAGNGNRARLLGQVLRELDGSLERASPGFRAANQNFSQASRNIDAIGEGATAAKRGRSEDIVPAFRAHTPRGQAGYRAGYVDPLIEQAQGAAFGVNKARPLINDAFAAESAAIAPMRTQQKMIRRIDRENTMFETRNHALGNSRTADNLADANALGIEPSVIRDVITGNFTNALRGLMSAGSNALTGNTAEVRQAVGQLLLQRGQNLSSSHVQRLLDDAVNRIQGLQVVARQLGRGGSAALAVTPAAISGR